MPLQLVEVIERVHAVEFAGVDDAHEEIADTGSVKRFVEERVLSLQHGLLQSAFTNIVVEWCPWMAQEERKPVPMGEEVLKRFAQSGVGLHLPFELIRYPHVQPTHDGLAVLLMVFEPLLRGELALTCLLVMLEYLAQLLEHEQALGRKASDQLDQLTAAVSQAVGDELLRRLAEL